MEEKKSFLDHTETVAAVTTFSLILLGILQIILGEIVSRSVALTANGIDCIGDGFVSGIVWVGLRYVRKPADHRFHFGYYKVENLASIAAAVVMLILAGYIAFRAYSQLRSPQEVQLPLIGAVIAFLSAIIAWGLGAYKYIKGKRSRLSSVKLDAFNTIKDGTTSFLTVIALLLSSWGYPIADAVVGFIIAGIIVSIGFAAIKESGYMLVDACDESCLIYQRAIRKIVERIEGVKKAQVVRLRRTGPVFQGEIEITVPGEMSVSQFDKIRSQIHQRVTSDLPEIERITIVAIPEEKTS
ncbi:MAG: cation diffusion facilitator family transporter [Euryarchaeota archaeon]|nr:cation diffusion facilitator family transporter [Euryarchaeota archaeon]